MDDIQNILLARWHVKNGTAQGIREAAGLSRAEVARSCGVSGAAVSLWEHQKRQPRGAHAIRYGALLRQLHVLTGAGA